MVESSHLDSLSLLNDCLFVSVSVLSAAGGSFSDGDCMKRAEFH